MPPKKSQSGGRKSGGRSAPKSSGARRDSVIRFLSLLLILPVSLALVFGFLKGGKAARLADAADAKIEEATAKAGFALVHVVVEGRKATPERDVMKALGVVPGRSIFSFDCVAARERLRQIDRIADADVRRLLPGTIHVELIERKPLAVWQHDGKLTLVDASGHMIADVNSGELDKFPHVVGVGAERNAAALLDVLARFPNIESRVRAAVRVGDRRWNLELSNGIEVWLPADGIETALSELIRLDREQGVLAREIESIDMRFKDRWILRVPAGATEIHPGPSRNT